MHIDTAKLLALSFSHVLFLPHHMECKKLTGKKVMKHEPKGVLERPLKIREVNRKFHNRMIGTTMVVMIITVA
jgi:hypothetical protein